MARAQETVTLGLLTSSLYLALYLGLVPLPLSIQTDIIPILPFWILVSFGAYLLAKLGYGILTFKDVPYAHEELVEEIKLARQDLRSLGVDVD